jgi:hypothetical protein
MDIIVPISGSELVTAIRAKDNINLQLISMGGTAQISNRFAITSRSGYSIYII